MPLINYHVRRSWMNKSWRENETKYRNICQKWRDTLLKIGFQTYIFCSKVLSKCRKCRFRDPNFKKFSGVHAPGPPYNCVVTMASPSLKSWLRHWSLPIICFLLGACKQWKTNSSSNWKLNMALHRWIKFYQWINVESSLWSDNVQEKYAISAPSACRQKGQKLFSDLCRQGDVVETFRSSTLWSKHSDPNIPRSARSSKQKKYLNVK